MLSDAHAVLLQNGMPASPDGPRHLAEADSNFLDELTVGLEAWYRKNNKDLHNQLQHELQKMQTKLNAQHEAAQAKLCSVLGRPNRKSKLFAFTVQGCESPGLSGCLFRQIFDAEPDSALAHMYNGEWQNSTDEKDRAVINSDAAHWPIIIRWLSFGTVPPNPTPELISECKYWQLDRLLAAIHAAERPGRVGTAMPFNIMPACLHGYRGFEAVAKIPQFPQQLEKAANKTCALELSLSAVGREWRAGICKQRLYLSMLARTPVQIQQFVIGSEWEKLNKKSSASSVVKGLKSGCALYEEDVQRLMHPGLVFPDGSVLIRIIMTFPKP